MNTDKMNTDTATDIIELVCKHYRIDKEIILGSSRKPFIILPRHVAMYLISRYTALTMTDIGSLFNKDHSTISCACKKIKNRVPLKLSLECQTFFKRESLFEILAKQNIGCDICEGKMIAHHGLGIENDIMLCDNLDCGAEILFPTSSIIDMG